MVESPAAQPITLLVKSGLPEESDVPFVQPPVSLAAVTRRRVAKVVSGGQSGADRAALDAAIRYDRRYGGWCPAGGWAEDYPQPPGLLTDYPLLRTAGSADPAVRTYLNVRDSQATLIVGRADVISGGTDLTRRTAVELRRPLLRTAGDAAEIDRWLCGLGFALTLNIAGPRESEQPGIYAATLELLERVFGRDDDGP